MLRFAGYNWAAKLLNGIINFSIIILLSHWLGAEQRGLAGLYGVVIAFALVANECGAGSAAIYLIRRVDWKQLRLLNYVWFLIASFSIVILFLILGKIEPYVFPFLLVACWLNAVNTFHLQLFLGHGAMKHFLWFQLLPPALVISIAAVFYKLGYTGAHWYLVALVVAWGASAAGSWWGITRLQWPGMRWVSWGKMIKEALRIAGPNQLGHLASILNNRLIFIFLPAISLGVYANALALAEALLLFTGSLGQVYYTRYAGRQQGAGQWQAYRRLLGANLLVLTACCIGVYLVPASWYVAIFGASFAGVKPMLHVLAPAALAYSVYLLASYHFSAKGSFIINLLCVLSGLVVQILGWAWFYFRGGASLTVGLWLTAISYSAIALVSLVFLSKRGFDK